MNSVEMLKRISIGVELTPIQQQRLLQVLRKAERTGEEIEIDRVHSEQSAANTVADLLESQSNHLRAVFKKGTWHIMPFVQPASFHNLKGMGAALEDLSQSNHTPYKKPASARGGWTPLHVAAERGNTEVVKLLLEAKADIDPKDDDGKTPLHWAVHSGRSEAVKVLIEAGADINARDNDGNTPLDIAIQRSGV